GKTTLLNRLLRDPALADTAVIINEFGEVAIDHLLVEQASDGIIQLSDGCLCCTVRGELVDTLADLVDRLQTGRIARLARVVIETTGLADPAPVLQSIMAHPALVEAFRLDGVITLVDAVNGDATLDAHVDHDHDHDHRHDSRVRSYSLVHDGPVPFSAIEMFLDLLRSAHGERLLRMKGVIELLEDPSRPLVVHGVQKILHPPARLPSWPDGQRGTRLVLIALDMPED
ncbi:MAG: GTP-binding protein, partial [Mesorhizobium sp.]